MNLQKESNLQERLSSGTFLFPAVWTEMDALTSLQGEKMWS